MIIKIEGVTYGCEWLPNGYVLVRSLGSGLQTLYDPETDALRGPSTHYLNHDLAAARVYVKGSQS